MYQYQTRIRTAHATETLAIFAHVALNLLKQDSHRQVGGQNTRLAAGWDDALIDCA